jgi:hypothetical protein
MVKHNINLGTNMAITRGQMTKQVDGQLRGARKKKAPKGYHYMPNGKLMKNSAHKKNRSVK